VILELGDGRELHLPDEMEDESARQLKAFILASEDGRKEAVQAVQSAHADMAAMRNEVIAAKKQSELTAEALKALQDSFTQGMAQLTAAISADREIVDETGERIRSRMVK
jgi:outer membrane protein TolC